MRGRSGQVVLGHGIYDLPYSWRNRMIDKTLIIAHQMESSDDSPRPLDSNAFARHVSAASPREPNPVTLRKAMNPKFADHQVWVDS